MDAVVIVKSKALVSEYPSFPDLRGRSGRRCRSANLPAGRGGANRRAVTGLVQLNRQVTVHVFGKSTEAMVLLLVPD